jgi:hypothetical protein
VPAQPDVIYVPQYDPDVVYVQPYSQNVGPLLTFGAGFAVGSWLNYDCDWGRHSIYVGQWRPGWNHDRNWDRGDQGRNWDRGDRGQNNNSVNVVNINSDTARQWQPSANSQRRQGQHQRSNGAHARSASVNTLDANRQPGGPSTPGLTRSADPRANHIPKPSRPDFTSQSNERIRRDSQDSNGSSKTSSGFPPAPNVATDATPRARGKNHKVSAPTVAPNVPDEQGTPGQSGGQGGNPRKLSKHVQSSHQSKGGANNQPTTTPSTMQPSTSTQKHQKHVDPSQSSSPQSNNSPHSSNGQKHQQKHAPQSAPSLAKQNKPSQPQPAAAHHEQNSQRSTASAPQNIAPQPSNTSHGKGKGKGGGEKKTDEKKNKGDN